MFYPSSVPPWNQLRFLTSDAIDVEERTLVLLSIPQDYAPLFWGAFSSLLEVDNWLKFGELTPEQMVDIGNNEVIMLDICQLVADCISESEAVQDAILNQIINNPEYGDAIIDQSSDLTLFMTDGSDADTQIDALDYVWGGLLQALVIWQDAVINLFVLMNAAVDALDAIKGLPGWFPPTDLYTSLVESAFNFGLAAVESDLKSSSTEEDFLCAIFDQICARGVPYILTDEDIKVGMASITFGSFPQPFFNFNKFKQYYTLGSDEPDNDWDTLCDCEPTSCTFFNLETEPSLPFPLSLNAQGVFVQGSGARGNNPETNNIAVEWTNPAGISNILSMTVEFEQSSNPNQTVFIQYWNGTSWVTLQSNDFPTSGRKSYEWTGTQFASKIRALLEASGAGGGNNWIYNVEVCAEF